MPSRMPRRGSSVWTGQIADLLPTGSLAPVVAAVHAMRGVAFIAAVMVMAQVRDLQRVDDPRQLRACPGLTPSGHSGGTSLCRGGVTRAGSGLARRAQIHGSAGYRPAPPRPAIPGRRPCRRLSATGPWNGPLRTCPRDRHPVAAGPAKGVVITAIARKRAAVIRAIAEGRNDRSCLPGQDPRLRRQQPPIMPMPKVGDATRQRTLVPCHGPTLLTPASWNEAAPGRHHSHAAANPHMRAVQPS
ncbi:transposase, partial [Paracoccus hibiscisoli]